MNHTKSIFLVFLCNVFLSNLRQKEIYLSLIFKTLDCLNFKKLIVYWLLVNCLIHHCFNIINHFTKEKLVMLVILFKDKLMNLAHNILIVL